MGKTSSSLGRNEQGETIITILIAVALLIGVFFIAAPSLNNMVKQNRKALATPNICRDVAQNIIHTIQSNGVQAKVFRTPVDSAAIFLNDSNWHRGRYAFNPEGVQSEVGSFDKIGGVRWPNKRSIEWQTTTEKYIVHSPLLIQGAVNGLLSVYNSPGNNVCTQPTGIPLNASTNLGALEPEDTIDNYKTTASMRIRPFNLNTGEVLGCSTPLWIRPYARTEPPASVVANIADYSNYRPDRGLEVEIFVETEKIDPDGKASTETHSCSVKERFHFDRQQENPKEPVISTTGSRLTVAMPFTDHDPGTHMICRSVHNFFSDHYADAVASVGAFTSGGSPSSYGPWLPCDRLTVCGSSPTTTIDRDTGTIENTYSVPPNCIYTVEAKAFDVAGNLSSNISTTFYIDPQPPITSNPSSDPSAPKGYEVGGLQFKTQTAALKAAAISGLPIKSIEEPIVGLDAQMNAAAAGLNGTTNAAKDATDSAAAASSAAAAAGAAAAAAGAAVAAATGPGSAASAAGSAASARSNANSAATSAASARSAASAASAAVAAAKASLDSVKGPAASLGEIGKTAVEKAEAAVKEAEKQEALALEAAIAAEKAAEAARKAAEEAERAAREKEEAERAAREDDDDD